MIESAVILKFEKGYVAELRFEDSSRDCSISSDTHEGIYKAIIGRIK